MGLDVYTIARIKGPWSYKFRVKSFMRCSFPGHWCHLARYLADIGYYVTGNNCLKCIYCDSVLQNWLYEDFDPHKIPHFDRHCPNDRYDHCGTE